MCGRITLLTLDELLEVVKDIEQQRDQKTGANPAADAAPIQRHGHPDVRTTAMRAQARPGSAVSAIERRQTSDGNGPLTLEIVDLVWGIEAPWAAREQKCSKLVFNTRIESALRGSGMWSEPISHGRCILPAASFFEPHATETIVNPLTGKSAKRICEFAMESGEPLLLASVRSNNRLSVVTTEPNDIVRPVHPRMPLALTAKEAPLWLEGELAEAASLANRSDVQLRILPEPNAQLDDRQLSLF